MEYRASVARIRLKPRWRTCVVANALSDTGWGHSMLAGVVLPHLEGCPSPLIDHLLLPCRHLFRAAIGLLDLTQRLQPLVLLHGGDENRKNRRLRRYQLRAAALTRVLTLYVSSGLAGKDTWPTPASVGVLLMKGRMCPFSLLYRHSRLKGIWGTSPKNVPRAWPVISLVLYLIYA